MRRTLYICIALFLSVTILATTGHDSIGGCPLVKIGAERLPDMNIPRSGHAILNVNGEVTVIGGRTTNFIPTPTAEYFKDGKWHQIPMAYEHDDGMVISLSSGKVLVAGGHEKPMGIGQTWGAELYDPATHTFEAFASLDMKRARSSAVEIDSGRVVIAGNWYADDGIELYDGGHIFSHVKEVSMGRSNPYILRTSKNNAIIFGSYDTKGKLIDNALADCLHGEPRHIPLLEEWEATLTDAVIDHSAAFIGDEQKDDYSYLVFLTSGNDSVNNRYDKAAIALVRNGEFSLLPTDHPIPVATQWGHLTFCPQILADRQSQRAYLLGFIGGWLDILTEVPRIYVLTIDYSTSPARLTLGHTDPLSDCDICYSALTADGNLILAGGLYTYSNFKPGAGSWLLHVSNRETATTPFTTRYWRWIAGAVILVVLAVVILCHYRRKKTTVLLPKGDTEPLKGTADDKETVLQVEQFYAELMERICQLMEQEKPFRNSELKMSDIAKQLGVPRGAISTCINKQRYCSFTQFVNSYRIDYAKELIKKNPNMKMVELYVAAGFSNESSFFRNFKAFTGMTPMEWKEKEG